MVAVAVVISCVSLAMGSFFYLQPQRTIDLQRWFYACINWRIEPISLEKEIRNTKAMGLFLLVVILVVWVYRLRAG